MNANVVFMKKTYCKNCFSMDSRKILFDPMARFRTQINCTYLYPIRPISLLSAVLLHFCSCSLDQSFCIMFSISEMGFEKTRSLIKSRSSRKEHIQVAHFDSIAKLCEFWVFYDFCLIIF